jgi:hypothetical protein
VNPHFKRILYFLLGEENAGVPQDMLRDSIWLLFVAFALSLFRSSMEHVLGKNSSFLSTVDESLFYTAMIAMVCRSLRRIYDWLLGGRVQLTEVFPSILTTSWGYAGCVLTLGTLSWGLLRIIFGFSFDDAFVAQTVVILIFSWGVTAPSGPTAPSKRTSR